MLSKKIEILKKIDHEVCKEMVEFSEKIHAIFNNVEERDLFDKKEWAEHEAKIKAKLVASLKFGFKYIK